MTGNLGKTIYISDAQSQIEAYGDYLRTRGLAQGTINARLSTIRKSLKEIQEVRGDIALVSLDGDAHCIIRERHAGSSKESVDKRIAIFAGFVRWCIGSCPGAFQDPASVSRHRADTAFIRQRFADEIAHMTEALEDEGRTKETIDNFICDAASCLTCLFGAFGVKELSEIDVRDMIWLDGNLAKSTPRKRNCMACLGRLVSTVGGADPYREFKSHNSMAAYEERLRGTPFGDEILAMALWMKNHNYRPMTIRTRVEALRAFLPRVIDIIGEFRLEDVTLDTFYLLRSRVDDVCEKTLCTYMSAFESLIQFSTGRRVYDGRRMMWNNSDVKRTFIRKEDWDVILDNAGRTERMAIMLASLLGMRCTEMVELRLVDISDTKVTIHGKGHGTLGKVAVKDIPPMLRKELDEYMGYRQLLISRYGDASEGRLIINDRQHMCAPLTRGALASRLATLSKKTGIPFSAHTFRRFYATTLYGAGIGTDVIKRMMRHECIDTTLRCYIEADPALMKGAEAALEQALFG